MSKFLFGGKTQIQYQRALRKARVEKARHPQRPCPSCPDGNVWGADGPTTKTCPVCNGHAVVNFDGSPINAEES